MAMKPSLFNEIAKSMARPNPFKKAAKYGMAGGNIGEQAEGVAARRNDRVRNLRRAAEERQGDLIEDEGYNFESLADDEYDNYIEEQLESLRSYLEDQKPGSWSDEAFSNGIEDNVSLRTRDWEPEEFETSSSLYDELPADAVRKYDKYENMISNSWDNRVFPGTPSVRHRTPDFQNWKKALLIQDQNKKLGRKLAKLNALSEEGKVVPKDGNAVVGGEGKGYSLEKIIAALRKQGASDGEIRDYLLRTKVQH